MPFDVDEEADVRQDASLTPRGLQQLEQAVVSDAAEDVAYVQAFNAAVVEELRAHGRIRNVGRDTDRLVLGVRGRRTGVVREIPLTYVTFDGRMFVVASRGGADDHPQWFYNLLADPAVTVEVGTRSFTAQAHVLAAEDRAAVFVQICASVPVFARYQSRTERRIPVVEIRPD